MSMQSSVTQEESLGDNHKTVNTSTPTCQQPRPHSNSFHQASFSRQDSTSYRSKCGQSMRILQSQQMGSLFNDSQSYSNRTKSVISIS